MKKIVALVVGVFIIAGFGVSFGGIQAADKAAGTHKDNQTHQGNNTSGSSSMSYINTLQEFAVLQEQIDDLNDMQAEIEVDNSGKRVILFRNENGQEQLKSIFIKHTNRLKIIDFDQGQIFNQVLNDKANQDENVSFEKQVEKVNNFAEFDTLKQEINADEDHVRVVEDNQYKRVMLITNKAGQEQYKSIFIKYTNHLKVINFDRGLVFNQEIK